MWFGALSETAYRGISLTKDDCYRLQHDGCDSLLFRFDGGEADTFDTGPELRPGSSQSIGCDNGWRRYSAQSGRMVDKVQHAKQLQEIGSPAVSKTGLSHAARMLRWVGTPYRPDARALLCPDHGRLSPVVQLRRSRPVMILMRPEPLGVGM
jgi:hypothetical protein